MRVKKKERLQKSNLIREGIKSPFPSNLKPMLATIADPPFKQKDWLYELKLDGYRIIAEINRKKDLGIYIVTTRNFQKQIRSEHKLKWEGSLSFEKVVRYLPHFKSAIQVPIYVYGLDL
jgi:hypothetical protein